MKIGRRRLLGGLVGAVGAVLLGKNSAVAKTGSPLLIGNPTNPTAIAEVTSLQPAKNLVATISVDTTEFEQELSRLQKTLEGLQEGKAVALPAHTRLIADVTNHSPANKTRDYINGLVDGGQLTFTAYWKPDYKIVKLLPKGKPVDFGVF